MKKLIIICSFILISTNLIAQHENETHNELKIEHEKHEESHGKNLIAVAYGYNHIREGVKVGNDIEDEGHWVSSIGIDYFRKVSERWEVGMKLDLQLGHYIIPHKDNLERENAFLILAIGSYELMPKWSIFAGGGMEFEKNEHLGVFRIGTEYAFHLKHNWAIPVGFFWDAKEGYDVFAFTVGIAKHF